jgi:hypothetical protein
VSDERRRDEALAEQRKRVLQEELTALGENATLAEIVRVIDRTRVEWMNNEDLDPDRE